MEAKKKAFEWIQRDAMDPFYGQSSFNQTGRHAATNGQNVMNVVKISDKSRITENRIPVTLPSKPQLG